MIWRSRRLSQCLVLILVVTQTVCHECALWLAPSHLGTENEPKYGLFAGRNYRTNETLPLAELAIPLIDMVESFNRKTRERDAILELWESYMWTAEFGGSAWEGHLSSPLAIPGVGMLPQFHTGISNVDFLQEGVMKRKRPKSPKTGTPHPSRGAITPYYNVTLKTTKAIPAGMELFADFGEVWDGNFTQDIYQDRIYRSDYDHADRIVKELVKLYEDLPDLSLEFQEDLLDFIVTKVLGVAAGKHAKTIRSLIPENPRKLQKVLDAGGTFLYRYPDLVRSPDWLSKNGYCMDSLRIGPSTIAYAGRGAFAARKFQRGEIITVSPMLHFADKNLLTMYPLKPVKNKATGESSLEHDHSSEPLGQQMLLNYCWGHPESSLLLFPMASHVSLINHQSDSPSARVAWARVKDNGLANQHKYQDFTVRELAFVDRPVVVMKFVAERDIEEGEEVTIDYGQEWSQAWEDYLRRWEVTRATKSHPWQAADAKDYYSRRPLETRDTIQQNPYPPNVATACFLHTRERPEGFVMQEGALRVNEWYLPDDPYIHFQGNRLYVVDVLERQEAGEEHFYNYTVLARYSESEFQRVMHVPHHSCTFVQRPYTSDIHLQGAFRQPIGVPDFIFPQKWRDLR